MRDITIHEVGNIQENLNQNLSLIQVKKLPQYLSIIYKSGIKVKYVLLWSI